MHKVTNVYFLVCLLHLILPFKYDFVDLMCKSDGDLVTIVDGSDLSFAIQCCRGLLSLNLFGKLCYSSTVE